MLKNPKNICVETIVVVFKLIDFNIHEQQLDSSSLHHDSYNFIYVLFVYVSLRKSRTNEFVFFLNFLNRSAIFVAGWLLTFGTITVVGGRSGRTRNVARDYDGDYHTGGTDVYREIASRPKTFYEYFTIRYPDGGVGGAVTK